MNNKKRIRLTNKKRFFTVILVFLVVVSTSLTSIIYASTSEKDQNYKLVTVHSGDTLWSISKEYSPDNIDIREYIFNVEKINGIKNSFIAEGDVLKIPVSN